MEVSRLQARAEDAERRTVGVSREIVVARTVALPEYKPSAEFEQVCADNFDKGFCAFIYNVWHEHPE